MAFRNSVPTRALLRRFASAVLVVLAPGYSTGQDLPQGITIPVALSPFDPDRPSCAAPSNLKPIIVLAKDNERDFVQGIERGLSMAARDRGLEFRVLLANNDPQRMVGQLEELAVENPAGLVISPVDPASSAESVQRVISAGSYVSSVVAPPATSLLNAPQYLTGKALADAAAAYIEEELGGNADVVLLTQDSIQFLTPRFAAIRDTFARMPGVRIVADISPSPVGKEGGLATMRTILIAHPNVDVVLGADGVVLGALQALREAGKDRPEMFLGGIDGEPEAVAEIRTGGPYKVSISLNSSVFAYAMGQHAADWLEGKQVPQAMDILPRPLSAANLDAYEADFADPGAVYADAERRASYLRMYGSICHESRADYINFPWSSEP